MKQQQGFEEANKLATADIPEIYFESCYIYLETKRNRVSAHFSPTLDYSILSVAFPFNH